jgi:hypothetical protein
VEVWRALAVVTESGELGAGHFRAWKRAQHSTPQHST